MKVSCQATCQKCYHELGRRQDLDVNDLVLLNPRKGARQRITNHQRIFSDSRLQQGRGPEQTV